MKKFIVLLLSALMLCGMLVSCTDTQTPNDTSEGTSDADTSETVSDIVILPEGAESTDYVILYPENSELRSECNELKGAIYGIRYINIWPKKDSEVEVGAHEILVGNTNRAESSELLSALADGEYGIKVINGKIVINSSTEKGVAYALEVFMDTYVTEENSTLAVPNDLSLTGKVPNEFELLDAGWTFQSYSASNNIDIPYQIYLPADMDQTKEYPVILFMHGLGSVGTTGEHITQTVAQFVKNVTASEYKNEVIIIAPQHPSGKKWVDVDYKPGTYDFDNTKMSVYMTAAKELFDAAFDNLPIDTDRVYGYGNSMGAFATIYLAMTYPDLYAAIVPVAGGCDPTKASLIKDLPIWLFHGDADTTVNWIGSKTLADNLTALGSTNVKMTVFKGVGHGAQDCFVAAANTDGLLEWMFSQSKAD